MMIEETEAPSKSQKKLDMHAIQALGERLAALNNRSLTIFPVDSRLLTAIADYKRFTDKEAKRRQMQFIGRLMAAEDVTHVKTTLDRLDVTNAQSKKKLNDDLENWQKGFLETPKDTLTAFIAQYPHCEIQQLRNLARNAEQEYKAGKLAKKTQALVNYLRQTIPEETS